MKKPPNISKKKIKKKKKLKKEEVTSFGRKGPIGPTYNPSDLYKS